MITLLVVLFLGFGVIAAAALLAPRLGIAPPLVLVAVGIAASVAPVFDSVVIDPEWIIQGLLPPLLYSSAVSLPAMNFRREFGAISGLSVALVIGTSVMLGLFFMVVIPGLGFAWGVALGAIVSPTDAVATSIVKRTPVSKRVVALLDGESLLNDATALVLLRTAIVATSGAFSFWGAAGTFAYSVVIAGVIGGAAGWLNLAVRKRVHDPTVGTVISFIVPFLASIPAELLHASGLVAAVVAGLVTGILAPRAIPPQNRQSDTQNWRTVELVLEGAVFLAMGLQINRIVASVHQDHAGIPVTILVASGALALTLLVRLVYVSGLLRVLRARTRRITKLQPRIHDLHERISSHEGTQEQLDAMKARRRKASERKVERFTSRLVRSLGDIEYFEGAPLGWREGTAVVGAGLRGAVTVAAAQTLPADTPHRSVLVLIAFTVAVLSLLIQGGTLGPLLRLIAPVVDRAAAAEQVRAERNRLRELMKSSVENLPSPPRPEVEHEYQARSAERQYRIDVLTTQRSALLDARDNGTFDADILADALAYLDAAQIALESQQDY